MVRTPVWWMLLIVALLSSGCTSAGEPRPAPTERPLVEGRCPRDGAGLIGPLREDDPYAGSLPPNGFRAARVIRCLDDQGLQQDDGTSIYTVTESSAEVSPGLLESLALPDEGPLGPNTVCPAQARSLLYLLLVDATGRGYQPRIPITPCHDPRPEVDQAVEAMTWRTETTFTIKHRD